MENKLSILGRIMSGYKEQQVVIEFAIRPARNRELLVLNQPQNMPHLKISRIMI